MEKGVGLMLDELLAEGFTDIQIQKGYDFVKVKVSAPQRYFACSREAPTLKEAVGYFHSLLVDITGKRKCV